MFMNKYGVLIGGLRLAKLGKKLTIATVIIFILRKMIVAITVIAFLN